MKKILDQINKFFSTNLTCFVDNKIFQTMKFLYAMGMERSYKNILLIIEEKKNELEDYGYGSDSCIDILNELKERFKKESFHVVE
jgi:hypothetical protein